MARQPKALKLADELLADIEDDRWRHLGTEPLTLCLQIRPDCRETSLTWIGAFASSVQIGPCRVSLWSELVVSEARSVVGLVSRRS